MLCNKLTVCRKEIFPFFLSTFEAEKDTKLRDPKRKMKMRLVRLINPPKDSTKYLYSAFSNAQKQKKTPTIHVNAAPYAPPETPNWKKKWTSSSPPENLHCSGCKMKHRHATQKTAELMGVKRNFHWKEFLKHQIGTELCEKSYTAISAYLCSECVEWCLHR